MSADERKIKCLVWDLDHTLWDGILLEGDPVSLPPTVRSLIEALDARGILQSVASRSDRDAALGRLRELGLLEYFLYPQVGWGAKSEAVRAIQEQLQLSLDAMALIDDQPFELEEVRHALPEVLCLHASLRDSLLAMPEFQPAFVTEDSRRRRSLYRLDMDRKQAEQAFSGPRDDFLASLGMVFTLSDAGPDDLQRAEELTVRTHQLNTTGYTYSYEELSALRESDDHLLLVAELEDRFGPYGTIGLVLVERGESAWLIKLLLMSCRVLGRGVGTIMLHHVMQMARDQGVPIRAEFRPTGRNEMMNVTYRFAGFRETARRGKVLVLEAGPGPIPLPPSFVQVRLRGRAARLAPAQVRESG